MFPRAPIVTLSVSLTMSLLLAALPIMATPMFGAVHVTVAFLAAAFASGLTYGAIAALWLAMDQDADLSWFPIGLVLPLSITGIVFAVLQVVGNVQSLFEDELFNPVLFNIAPMSGVFTFLTCWRRPRTLSLGIVAGTLLLFVALPLLSWLSVVLSAH